MMLIRFLCLGSIFLLTGCATGGPPQVLTSTRVVDSSQAFALPPAGGPAIVSVVERPYNNAVQQEILLATSSRTPGQNVLRVQLFGPVKASLSGGSTLSDRPLGATDISRELRGTLPGVAMSRSPYFVQNQYGPFGYATGHSSSGDTCIYAWQRIRPPESSSRWLRGQGTVQVRLRLCDSELSEEQLLSVMYGFSINAAFNDIRWNPYGDPIGPDENLGRPGAGDVYPNGPESYPRSVTTRPEPAPPPRRVVRSTPAQSVESAPVRAKPIGPVVPPPPGSAGSVDIQDQSKATGTGGRLSPVRPASVDVNTIVPPPPPSD